MSRTTSASKGNALGWGALLGSLLVTVAALSFNWIDTSGQSNESTLFQATEQVVLQVGKEYDVVIAGQEKDRFGFALAVGDVDSDGRMDLFTGVPDSITDGAVRVGAAVGFLGAVEGNLMSVSSAAWVFKGFDFSATIGSAVALADLNEDGHADFVVSSADMAVDDNRRRSGIVFVVLGPMEAGSFDLRERADFRILGAERNNAAGKGLTVGDLNNDGSVDLAIGSPGGQKLSKGGVDILFGPFDGADIDLREGSDAVLVGIDGGDAAGTTLAVGDINGDSIDDLVINSRQADPNGANNAGETYIVFGPIEAGVTDLATGADITIRGRDKEELSGSGLAVGDLNGDGISELVIGSMAATASGRVGAGKVLVLEGPLQTGTLSLHDTASVVIEGEHALDRLGASAAIADMNGDDRLDIVMGASFADPDGVDGAGVAYVMYGNIFDRESTPAESPLPQILIGMAVIVVLVGGGALALRQLRRVQRGSIPL